MVANFTDPSRRALVRVARNGKGWEKHGLSGTPEYTVWQGMLGRCHNPNHSTYDRYGGRGIYVCTEWHSFPQFLDDMGPRPSDRHSIERIDNDGPYSKENCKWATLEEQAHNRHCAFLIVFNGEEKTLAEWGRVTGLKSGTIRQRLLNSGWSVEEALTLPVQTTRRKGFRTSKVS